jgi:hypothetical protein
VPSIQRGPGLAHPFTKPPRPARVGLPRSRCQTPPSSGLHHRLTLERKMGTNDNADETDLECAVSSCPLTHKVSALTAMPNDVDRHAGHQAPWWKISFLHEETEVCERQEMSGPVVRRSLRFLLFNPVFRLTHPLPHASHLPAVIQTTLQPPQIPPQHLAPPCELPILARLDDHLGLTELERKERPSPQNYLTTVDYHPVLNGRTQITAPPLTGRTRITAPIDRANPEPHHTLSAAGLFKKAERPIIYRQPTEH